MTVELQISVKLDNAAMTAGEEGLAPDGPAVAGVLRELAGIMEDGVGTSGRIKDANGNMTGEWTTVAEYDRTLTITQAGYLRDLIAGVERGGKIRWYQAGAGDADHPVVQVLRAFTYDGGGLYPHDADIRDAYVWTSGFMERWFKVSDVLTAMNNTLYADAGLDQPMAVIEIG